MPEVRRTSGRMRGTSSFDSASAAEAGLGVVKRQVPLLLQSALCESASGCPGSEEPRARVQVLGRNWVADVGLRASWYRSAMGNA